ncbi:hypothetical protein V5O48_006679, partial [Marasmius crinis-equi]
MAPPLAGRPPFATDEPDSIYETPSPQRRYRQPKPSNPNDRTSAYDTYDDYLDYGDSDPASHPEAGADLKSPSPRTENKHALLAAAAGVKSHTPSPPPQYIAAPKPGYVASVASFSIPSPAGTPQPPPLRQPQHPVSNPFEPQRQPQSPRQPQPQPRQQQQNPFEPPRQYPAQSYQPHPNQYQNQFPHPHAPPPPQVRQHIPRYGSSTPIPSTPHPLQPPITPITPVFVRPSSAANGDVKFSQKPIMRSTKEDTFLPSRGNRGDDFWKRFSMVAHEQENPAGKKKSKWLRETQAGASRMSWCVWIIGLAILLVVGGAIGLGWWISHNNKESTQPGVLGGSADETAGPVPSKVASQTGAASSGSKSGISPTFTVARRA